MAGHEELGGRVDVGGHGEVGSAKGCGDESGTGEGKRRARVRQRVEGDLIDRPGAMDARRVDGPSMDARETASTPLMNMGRRWGARQLGLVAWLPG